MNKFKNSKTKPQLSELEKLMVNTGNLFIHIPKTAGISVGIALYGILVGHHGINYWENILTKRELDSLFKFTIFRNPIDRFVSAYNYLMDGGLGHSSDLVVQKMLLEKYLNISDLINDLINDQIVLEHFKPQHTFIRKNNGQILIDKIVNFSNLYTETESLAKNNFDMKKLELLNINRYKGKLHTTKNDLASLDIEKLQNFYKTDFELMQNL